MHSETIHDNVSPSTPTFSNISSSEPTVYNDSSGNLMVNDPDKYIDGNTSPHGEMLPSALPAANEVDLLEDCDQEPMYGYKMIGDNVDKMVKSRYTHLNKSYSVGMHYYHYYALRDCINISGIPDVTRDLESIPLLSIPIANVLPSTTDEKNLYNNFIILIS